ncbi:MAG: family transporter [Acidobacteria bacterium]|nr:family transporter [Acidobacteriota bacterium]
MDRPPAPRPEAYLDRLPWPAVTHLAALAGVLAITFSPIFVRLSGLSPATVAFWRLAYALPFVFTAWLMVRGRDPRPLRSRAQAAAAGLFLAVDLFAWHHSIARIGAGPATLVGATQVAFVGLVAWALYRERPSRLTFAVLPVVLGGVALLSGLGAENAYGEQPLAGVLLGLGSALCYSCFLLLLRHSNRGHLAPSPGPLLDATLGALAGTAVLALFDPAFTLAPSWPAHGWLLALAVVCHTAGWIWITGALPRLPALEVSGLLLVQPAGAVVWAQLIFAERLAPVQWAGVGVVLGGILVLVLWGAAHRPGPPVPIPEPLA